MVFPGDRVVIRYRLAPGAPGDWRGGGTGPDGAAESGEPTLSDVTGLVVEPGDPIVLTRVTPAAVASDDHVHVPAELVTSVRLLPYRAVRNNEIRAVSLRAVEAAETAEVEGWLVRSGAADHSAAPVEGPPLNTAVPARMGTRLDAVAEAAVTQWFAQRGLPAIIELPDRLVPGVTIGTPVGGQFHRLVHVADDGTESTVVTVAEDDEQRGARLRAEGYRLHHRVTYRRLG